MQIPSFEDFARDLKDLDSEHLAQIAKQELGHEIVSKDQAGALREVYDAYVAKAERIEATAPARPEQVSGNVPQVDAPAAVQAADNAPDAVASPPALASGAPLYEVRAHGLEKGQVYRRAGLSLTNQWQTVSADAELLEKLGADKRVRCRVKAD